MGLRKLEDEKRELDGLITECRSKIEHKKRLETRIGTMEKQVVNLEKERLDVDTIHTTNSQKANVSNIHLDLALFVSVYYLFIKTLQSYILCNCRFIESNNLNVLKTLVLHSLI